MPRLSRGLLLESRHTAHVVDVPAGTPDVVALVSLIGQGASVGAGTTLEGIDLSAASTVPQRSIPVGTFPDAIAVAPNGRTAYVVNYTSNSVTPVDLRTGRPGTAIPVGSGPAGIAITPDGKTAYVTDAGSSPIGDTVTPINLKTGHALAPITVGTGPQGIAITPDGSTAYVADAGAIVTGQSGAIGHTVTPIDLKTGAALPPITVGNAPIALAVAPDGSVVYVANSNSGSVTPITVAGNAPGPAIGLSGPPIAIAMSSSTAWVAVSSSAAAGASDLTPISLTSGTAGKPIPVGKALTSVVITPDGQTAWIVSSGTNSLVPVDLGTDTAMTADSVATGPGPYALALLSEPHATAIASLGSLKATKTTKGKTTTTSH